MDKRISAIGLSCQCEVIKIKVSNHQRFIAATTYNDHGMNNITG
tara:strand:+ start:902 stop:1033 length:132 start_codon:yes stop_codon:yes gene_type:complete